MIKPESFYHSFQINYYDYKQLSYKYLLDNLESTALDKQIIGYNQSDYERALKSSIRQTYFHAIETLFEIVFSLVPNDDGTFRDLDIMRTITLSNLPYKRIEKIANGEDDLQFLDNVIKNSTITTAHHIFYFGLQREDLNSRIKESIENIKSFLIQISKDFADRREYNSYKHGLRLIPALQSIAFADTKTGKNFVDFDARDSMTFYSENIKTEEIEFITKTFDPIRDISMTSLISNIIWNIIGIRRTYLFPKAENFELIFFEKDHIMKSQKHNIKLINFKFKLSK